MTEKLEKMAAEITANRKEIIEKLVQYSLTDMLFFWSTEKEIAERQEKEWQPLLDWAKEEFQTNFVKTRTLNVPEQEEQSGWRLKLFLESLSDRELAAFYAAATNMRSVLLAAALIKGRISADQAFRAAFLEELVQAESWGSDEEAEKRRGALKQELVEVENFLKDDKRSLH